MVAPAIVDPDSDYDDYDDADPVLLGFVQRQATRHALVRDRFPSKVGGRPAWLDPEHVPEAGRLTCSRCGRVMRFLAQIYAPVDDVHDAFHRTLFVFCCIDAGCASSQSSVRVLRSQLPRANPYYPNDLPAEHAHDVLMTESEEGFAPDPDFGDVKLCNVCGLRAPKGCAGCRRRFYCSRDHQVMDWRSGHSGRCSAESSSEPACLHGVFPQFEICIEDEDDIDEAELTVKEKAMLKHYESEVSKLKGDDVEDHEKLSFDSTAPVDDVFVEFQQRMQRAPAQCFRYRRGAARPLWTHSKGQLADAEAQRWRCGSCGGAVVFEFQILPQLLAFLDADPAFDFGTIAVYTCRASCSAGNESYREEHVWRQGPAAPM